MNQSKYLVVIFSLFFSSAFAQNQIVGSYTYDNLVRRGGEPDTILGTTRIDTAESFDFNGNLQTKVWTRLYNYNLGNVLLNTIEDHELSSSSDVRNTYTYDADNNLISILTEEGNVTAGIWSNSLKIDYQYDANNNETSQITQDYINNAWVNLSKIERVYNLNQHLTTSYFEYDTLNNQWIKNYEEQWEYIVGLKMNGYRVEFPSSMADTVEMYQLSYNNDGNQDSIVTLRKDTSLQSFVNHRLTSRTFLGYQQIENEIESLWNNIDSTWDFDSQHKYIYNTNNELWRDSTLSYINNSWQRENVIIYKRSPIVIFSSQEELENQLKLSLYPNPAIDELYLAIEGLQNPSMIKIYDQQGRLIQNYAVQNEINRIDISTLKAGIYFVEITLNDKSSIRQFVKSN